MEKINMSKEILARLAKLQEDVEYIKIQIKTDKELEMEIIGWERTALEDTTDFLEEHNL